MYVHTSVTVHCTHTGINISGTRIKYLSAFGAAAKHFFELNYSPEHNLSTSVSNLGDHNYFTHRILVDIITVLFPLSVRGSVVKLSSLELKTTVRIMPTYIVTRQLCLKIQL